MDQKLVVLTGSDWAGIVATRRFLEERGFMRWLPADPVMGVRTFRYSGVRGLRVLELPPRFWEDEPHIPEADLYKELAHVGVITWVGEPASKDRQRVAAMAYVRAHLYDADAASLEDFYADLVAGCLDGLSREPRELNVAQYAQRVYGSSRPRLTHTGHAQPQRVARVEQVQVVPYESERDKGSSGVGPGEDTFAE